LVTKTRSEVERVKHHWSFNHY